MGYNGSRSNHSGAPNSDILLFVTDSKIGVIRLSPSDRGIFLVQAKILNKIGIIPSRMAALERD